ncbi:MAG TPA: hypothetical protein PK239_12080 [Chitinophagales bacterium]|nr:hypothetical protein [Chitinophagales bacterium]HRK28009.1 hypothetical protein [Chitinophagales bacterium]
MQETNQYLQKWWSKVVQKDETKPQTEAMFVDLLKRYSAPARYYHNTTHLAHLFSSLTPYMEIMNQPDAVIWAVFYHDIVYNPLRKDNEAKSARFAQKIMQNCHVLPQTIHLTQQLILATQYHLAPNDALVDFYYFLDADLAILGQPPAVYQQYALAIRNEYRLIPDMLYKPGRRKVLEQLLQKPFLYYSHAFRAPLETQARQNIQTEINSL